jgi:hypothetical protein
VQFDTALNVVWLLLGITALAGTIRANIRQRRTIRCSGWLHIVGVALIVAALFPYISATDDLVRGEDLTAGQHQNHSSSNKKNPNESLIRLYETLDSPLACATCSLTVTFFAVWLVLAPLVIRDRRIAPACAGRSPPLGAAI